LAELSVAGRPDAIFRVVLDDYVVDYQVAGEVVNSIATRRGRQRPPDSHSITN
jgi:hypothetical protein